jgi:putative membrane protein
LRQRGVVAKIATKRKLAAYLAGLATLALALLSPIDWLGGQLLFMHMIQHKLMIMIAAPLLWLGTPFPVMLWGLPGALRKPVGTLFTREAGFRRLLTAVTNPGIAWLLFIIVYMGWHDPNAYNAALRYGWVHNLEHLSFFGTALLFWWHVVGAAPHLHHLSVWGRLALVVSVIPFQMAAGIVIATADTVIYSYYESVPHIWGFTALADQAIAGAIMWIPSSEMLVWAVVFLLGGLAQQEKSRAGRGAVRLRASNVR